MKLAEMLYEAGRRAPNKRQKLLFELLDNLIFLLIIPFAAIYISVFLDGTLKIRYPVADSLDFLPSLFITAFGLFWIAWSDSVQLRYGGGSTLPLVPAQRLVVNGPYAYTRNPILFGYIFFLTGLGVLFHSFLFTFAFTPIWVLLNVFYVMLVEEKELKMKFGEDYARYRSGTPLLFPKRKADKFK
jgi:protein-S-isoprenylcysteine O-methyltransferase Ste14